MNGTQSLRIAVTGLAATYPFGGVFWDYMQYVLGFHRLGHDVLYIEDTGKWCYDPVAQTFTPDATRNAEALGQGLKALEPKLADRWFLRDASGAIYGRSWGDVVRFVREADLFLHISASCWMREEYFACRRLAFIDSDPIYTQASVPAYLNGTASEEDHARIDTLRRHDVFFTFGENINGPDCRIPRGVFDWKPTRQPVVLPSFEAHRVPVESRRRVLTTVASWEPTEKGPVVDGVAYKGKSVEFTRFQELPSRSQLPLEIAMSGPAPYDDLRRGGWRIINAYDVTSDPWRYRGYLANSLGEWSVAKNAYVASCSGWFSCRSACYLALGVPVVVQDTGFGCAIPEGEGILAFQTPAEAAEAIGEIAVNPQRHARAAAEIAREYFCAETVLTDLVEQAMGSVGDGVNGGTRPATLAQEK